MITDRLQMIDKTKKKSISYHLSSIIYSEVFLLKLRNFYIYNFVFYFLLFFDFIFDFCGLFVFIEYDIEIYCVPDEFSDFHFAFTDEFCSTG